MSACAGTSPAGLTEAPPPPCPGPAVAEELEQIPYEGYEDFWRWLDRTYRLFDQLSEARDEEGC